MEQRDCKDHGGDLWVWVYLKGSTDPCVLRARHAS